MPHIEISSPVHDSPKKPRVAPSPTKKPCTTPLKSTPAKTKAASKSKTASPTKVKTTPAAKIKTTSPSKAASARKRKAYVNLCPCNQPYKIIDYTLTLALPLTMIMTDQSRNLQSVTMIQGTFIHYFQVNTSC